MKEDVEISVYNVVGDSLCVDPSDGQKIYEKLVAVIKTNRKVILSFRNVSIMTYAFLNSAIGQLYDGRVRKEKIHVLLKVEDISAADAEKLKRVIKTAKEYFKQHKETL